MCHGHSIRSRHILEHSEQFLPTRQCVSWLVWQAWKCMCVSRDSYSCYCHEYIKYCPYIHVHHSRLRFQSMSININWLIDNDKNNMFCCNVHVNSVEAEIFERKKWQTHAQVLLGMNVKLKDIGKEWQTPTDRARKKQQGRRMVWPGAVYCCFGLHWCSHLFSSVCYRLLDYYTVTYWIDKEIVARKPERNHQAHKNWVPHR